MQPKRNLQKSLLASALLLSISNASIAGSNPYTVSAQAIADVSIIEVTPLSFGNRVDGNAGSTCTLLSLEPGDTDVNADLDFGAAGAGLTASSEGANWNAISGNCKTGGEASGVYEVAGEPGSTFSITLAAVDAGDFTFTPDYGCYVIWDDDFAVPATGTDSCGYLSSGTVAGVEIPATNADVEGDLNPGKARFSIGGTLTVVNDLTPNTGYNPTFDIVVAYD